jgi:adenine-specific DNA-methyltransferase
MAGKKQRRSAQRADSGEEFSLQAQEMPQAFTRASKGKGKGKAKPSGKRKAGDPQVISYRHRDKRKNNPQVGLVNPETDPEQPKTTWAYDPHLDPTLQFDVGRAQVEKLIDGALASGESK